MNITIIGGKGLLGAAIAREFRDAGHKVATTARSGADIDLDLRFDNSAEALLAVIRGADIVVNATGVLIERDGNTWDVVHRQAANAIASACETGRVARLIHISALGVGTGLHGAYMASKLGAEEAVAAHAVDYAIIRPGLLVDVDCPSTRIFRQLSRLPVIGLPGLVHPGGSLLAPIQVADVARCVVRIATHPKALRRVIELAGPEVMSYRDMLARHRASQGQGAALWLPVPWALMKLASLAAALLPQKVVSIDTMRMLQAGSVTQRNEAARWLGREPRPMLQPASGQGGLGAAAAI